MAVAERNSAVAETLASPRSRSPEPRRPAHIAKSLISSRVSSCAILSQSAVSTSPRAGCAATPCLTSSSTTCVVQHSCRRDPHIPLRSRVAGPLDLVGSDGRRAEPDPHGGPRLATRPGITGSMTTCASACRFGYDSHGRGYAPRVTAWACFSFPAVRPAAVLRGRRCACRGNGCWSGGLQAFLQSPLLGGEVTDTLLKRGVAAPRCCRRQA
jgi:hypothetical protein